MSQPSYAEVVKEDNDHVVEQHHVKPIADAAEDSTPSFADVLKDENAAQHHKERDEDKRHTPAPRTQEHISPVLQKPTESKQTSYHQPETFEDTTEQPQQQQKAPTRDAHKFDDFRSTKGSQRKQDDDRKTLQRQKERNESKKTSTLQKHVAFFDRDNDGVIWPLDTYRSLRDVHWNILLSLVATLFIHGALSWFTQPSTLTILRLPRPDIFFRIYVATIDRARHGSDSGSYAAKGEFISARFDYIFNEFSSLSKKDGLTLRDTITMLNTQRDTLDLFGWAAATLEWLAVWLLLWPSQEKGGMKNGVIWKDDVKGVFDGSMFWTMAGQEVPARLREYED